MNEKRPKNTAWEEWQLTAFVLGELDAEMAKVISAAAAEDARLSAEITDIRQTLKQVNRVFQAESLDGLATGSLPTGVDCKSQQAVPSADTLDATSRRSRIRSQLAWYAVLGSAAVLMLALFVVVPSLNNWRMASSAAPQAAPGIAPQDRTSSSVLADELARVAAAKARQTTDESIVDRVAAQQRVVREAWKQAEKPEPADLLPPAQQPTEFEELSGMQLAKNDGSAATPEPTSSGSRPGDPVGGPGIVAGDSGLGMGSPGKDAYAGGYGGGMGGYGRGYAAPSSGYGGEGGDGGYGIPSNEAGAMYGGGMYGGGYGDLDAAAGAPAFGTEAAGLEAAPVPRSRLAKSHPGGSSLSAAEPDSRFYRESRAPRSELLRGGVGDRFESSVENEFQSVSEAPLSTFSIDVDSASYTKCRQLLLEAGRRPPPAAVRIEEFINYFDYEYAGPQGDDPFGAELAVATCPWQPRHKLVRIALQATRLEMADRPQANIVFLLDVSGSMNAPNKLPLVKESMRMLVEQLGENDNIAMAVYAGAAGCVLEGTSGDQQARILGAIENLKAGGSTNGGQGIQLAYNLARDNFIPGGINRVILCTDGDFNVGVTNTDALVELVEANAKSKIFLTVLGYGMGNTNDAMMEQISNRGNGVYGFVDTRREAHRQMVRQLAGNLMTVAKDVKIQVEFNPQQVHSYRLVGYENRMLAAEDFNDDQKDAGEIGAGHRVTALYEIVPVGQSGESDVPQVDPLRYQPAAADENKSREPQPESTVESEFSNELLAVKLRYKQPEGDTSRLLVFPLEDREVAFSDTDRDFQWAAAVAQFAMLLRESRFSGQASWQSVLEQATAAAGVNPNASQQECLEMIRRCLR